MRKDGSVITPPSPSTAALAALRSAVQRSPLAIAMLQLPRRRFLEVSDRARRVLGLESVDITTLDALTLSKEPDDTYRLFTLIVEGALDGYRARRVLRGGGAEIDAYVCLRVIARSGETWPSASIIDMSLSRSGAREVIAIANYIDESERAAVEAVPQGHSAEFLLTSVLDLVHPDDVCLILETFESAATSGGAQGSIHVRCGGSRRWQRTRVLVSCVGAPDRFSLTLAPLESEQGFGDLDRAAELERRLRRIADEIEAAGLFQRVARLPDPDRVPGLDSLSSRQWEIVTRLLRGERVPRIARAMYLSPSTVRNHLSTIFRKLGVHSQAELIDRLHPPD
jgi:DNA-binding CsgD family transcriptional regulator